MVTVAIEGATRSRPGELRRVKSAQDYERISENGFEDYRLEVYRLVDKPRKNSLDALSAW